MMLQTSIATTTTMPSASANTGSEVSARQPPQVRTTAPVWSATHAAPAAASAINSRKTTIRIMKGLLRRLGERRHGVRGKLSGRGKRCLARRRLVEPALRGRAIGRRQRQQFAPRLVEIVAQ